MIGRNIELIYTITSSVCLSVSRAISTANATLYPWDLSACRACAVTSCWEANSSTVRSSTLDRIYRMQNATTADSWTPQNKHKRSHTDHLILLIADGVYSMVRSMFMHWQHIPVALMLHCISIYSICVSGTEQKSFRSLASMLAYLD